MEVDSPAAVPTLDGVLLTTSGGSATTLLRHATKVTALVVCAGHVFFGDEDGEVGGWALHSLQAFVTKMASVGTAPHVGAVFALEAFAMDEPLLFSAAADGLLAWDVTSRQCRGSLQGHTSAVVGLAISQGLVASGSTDGELRFWEPVSRRCVADVAAHSAPIQALAALQHGLLASACRGGHVRLWRVEEQERHSTSRGERVAVRVASLDAHGGDWITCLAPLWPEAQAGSGWPLEPAGSSTGSPLGRGWLREPQPPAHPCAHAHCMPPVRTRGPEARPSGRDPALRRGRESEPDASPLLASAGLDAHVVPGADLDPGPVLSPDPTPSPDPDLGQVLWRPGVGGLRVWRPTRLAGHKQPIGRLCALRRESGRPALLASADWGGAVRVWELASASCVRVLSLAAVGWIGWLSACPGGGCAARDALALAPRAPCPRVPSLASSHPPHAQHAHARLTWCAPPQFTRGGRGGRRGASPCVGHRACRQRPEAAAAAPLS